VADGKVFIAALDGWMYALDAKTGKVVWKTDFIENRAKGDNSTGAPEIAGDVVSSAWRARNMTCAAMSRRWT
jgi:quinohemoprotein ethanol dehydrogenase